MIARSNSMWGSGKTCGAAGATRRTGAFTLIELMIVVGIIGVVATIGIPSIARTMQREGMRKVLWDLQEACETARSIAILGGKEATLTLSSEGHLSVNGAIEDDHPSASQFPENIVIDSRWHNAQELAPEQQATIRFQPNGTCDEFWLVLRSDENEVYKITLDIITGLPDVEQTK
jgi:prepilin-type N-terminal cleavage/methylation domain-containing protein